MITRRNFATFALAAPVALAAPRPVSAFRPVPKRGRITDASRLLDVARVPALSYALVERGHITQSGAIGTTKAGGPAATAATYFDAASLTKPVFATAAIGLAREGAIDLDRPLEAYLPMFGDARTRKITARHVLSHTSGLPNWHFSAKEPLKSEFEPGSQWGYSGEAHFMLLRVLEHLTGKTLAEMMDQYAFRPAGMKHSSIVWTEAVAADNAWPHDNWGDPMDDPLLTQNQSLARFAHSRAVGLPLSRWRTQDSLEACEANKQKPVPGNVLPNPAFGLWTDAADLARLLVFAARQPGRDKPLVKLRGNLAWGLGWGLELGRDGPFAWQWGDTSGVKNIFVFHLPTQTGIVALTNGDNGLRVYRRLVRQFFSREFDAFLWV